VHIWFFKSMPSRLGTLLGMKTSDLEKVIYYQDYVVTDAGRHRTEVQADAHRGRAPPAVEKYGNAFKATWAPTPSAS
jgi:DNA-directed RNA polymerase subunit beta'